MVLRMGTFALVELQKLRHDRTELVTRMVQPALWLLIFGQVFSRLQVIDTGSVPYLAFLAPGIIAQSALFISIFYGIQIIWDRDAGILAKLMVTPAPASALVAGKSFAAGVRSVAQVIGVMVIAFPQLFENLDVAPIVLFGAGGLLYSAGAVIYALRRPDPWQATFGFHEIFHALVVAAAITHFVAMAGWVIPAG